MTEQALEGAATAADTPVDAVTTPPQGSQGGEVANPFEGLDADLLEQITKAGVKDLSTLAKGYVDKEKFIQSSPRYPGADDAEKLTKFYEKLRPETVEGYSELDLKALPEDFPLDKGVMAAAQKAAFDSNIPDELFKPFIEKMLADPEVTGINARVDAARSEQADAAAIKIAEDFGGQGSETYNAAVASVNGLFEQVPELGAALSSWGVMDATDNAILDATVFTVLHKLSGAAAVLPSGKIEADAGGDGDVGIDPNTGAITNATKAAALYNRDPDSYRRMTKQG